MKGTILFKTIPVDKNRSKKKAKQDYFWNMNKTK